MEHRTLPDREYAGQSQAAFRSHSRGRGTVRHPGSNHSLSFPNSATPNRTSGATRRFFARRGTLETAMAAHADTKRTTHAAERERVLAALRQQAPKLRGLGITRLSLFGSTARGDSDPKSDIDLLVELDPQSRFSLFELVDLQDDPRALLAGRPTSPSLPSYAPGCATRSCKRRSRSTAEAGSRPPPSSGAHAAGHRPNRAPDRRQDSRGLTGG
jgi:predicted nucleotidyltransferase